MYLTSFCLINNQFLTHAAFQKKNIPEHCNLPPLVLSKKPISDGNFQKLSKPSKIAGKKMAECQKK